MRTGRMTVAALVTVALRALALRTLVPRTLVPLALVLLTGCASTLAGSGHGMSAPSAPPTSAPSTPPSGGTPPPPATTPPTAGPAVTPCPGADPGRVARCLQAGLSQYWSGQLNEVVAEPIVLDAVPSDAPAPCRSGIEAGAAITCRSDLHLYVSSQFLALIAQNFAGPDAALALASVASHEFGHVLQYTLHQPQIERAHPTDADSRFVEQQADCLSGVWAGQAARHGALDQRRFLADAVKLITLVSSNAEIAGHGTPPQRRAAIERGLAGATAGACGLVSFH